MVKTPEGELSTTAIRKLIKAHNVLMSIKIPVGSTREDIMKIITKNGYEVNHKKGYLVPVVKMKRKPTVRMKQAETLLKKPPKTALQKQKAQEAKEAREEKKKKELRKIKKEVVEKVIDRKKLLKKKSVNKSKQDMPKPKQPKQTQKLKSQKEDEVRPKEKVGRPKVDPKKIKVIEPKKKEEKDLKIGDTYLFKIKNKDFEGIATNINDKSVSMLFRWVNGNILKKPIKKEDIIKRLGGTNYDEDLGERYEMSNKKKEVKLTPPSESHGYEAFKKKLDKAVETSGQSLDRLTKKSKERLAKIEEELKDGTNKRSISEIKIQKSQTKATGTVNLVRGDKFNLIIKFGFIEGEEITQQAKNKIPRATILPFEKDKK